MNGLSFGVFSMAHGRAFARHDLAAALVSVAFRLSTTLIQRFARRHRARRVRRTLPNPEFPLRVITANDAPLIGAAAAAEAVNGSAVEAQ